MLARRKVKPKYQITSVRRSSTTSLPEAPIEALPQTPGVQSATLSQRHRRPRLQASELQTPCTPRLTRALMHARMHGRMDAACMDSCMDAPTYLSYESMYALTGHACTTYLLLCLCFVLYHSLLALSLSLGLCRRASRCLSLSLSRFALFYNVLSPSCKPVRLGLGFHAPVPLRLVVVTAAAGDPCSKNPPPRLRSSASVGCHPAADPEDIIKLYTETLNL